MLLPHNHFRLKISYKLGLEQFNSVFLEERMAPIHARIWLKGMPAGGQLRNDNRGTQASQNI